MKHSVIKILVYLLLSVISALPISDEDFEAVSRHPQSGLTEIITNHAKAVDKVLDKLSEFETDSLLSIDLMSSRISLSSSASDTAKDPVRSIHSFAITLGRYMGAIEEITELLQSLPKSLFARLDTLNRADIAKRLAGEAEADTENFMSNEEEAHLAQHRFEWDYLPRVRGFLRNMREDLEKMEEYRVLRNEQANNMIEDDYFFI